MTLLIVVLVVVTVAAVATVHSLLNDGYRQVPTCDEGLRLYR